MGEHYVDNVLFQAFDQDRVVDVFASNEGERIFIGREREMGNLQALCISVRLTLP
jgi:hypothetical protein